MTKPKPESLFGLQFPSDPQLSPDGQQVAYVLGRVAEEKAAKKEEQWPKPRYRSRIMLAGAEGERALTQGEGRDTAPRWSPDGSSLAFLSDRSGKSQLYLLPLGGGEARALTAPADFPQGVSAAQWSPDGRYLAFLAQEGEVSPREERGEARVITRLKYRANGADFLPDEPAALWCLQVEGGEVTRWLMPQQPIGEFTWWPDSRGVLLTSSQDEVSGALWKQEAYDLPLGGEPRQLTDWAAPISHLAPHPDGLRFVAQARRQTERNDTDSHLYLFVPSGETYAAERLDQHDYPAGSIVAGDLHVGQFPERPVWLGEERLLFSATVGGASGLFTADLAGQVQPHTFDAERVVAGFSANANGAAWLSESATQVPQVRLNGRQVSDCPMPDFAVLTPQRVTFTNELGEGEGWVLLPEAQEPRPALLNVHGGPHTAYGHGFMHEFQLFAAQGYAVCYSNPRGSVGYGQAWSSDIFGRWGSVDADDVLAFFDVCLDTLPLDRQRTAVMGGSYGGFMTNWLTSHTGRFQAAITDRSICNLISFGGTSDIGMRFWDDELGGNFQRSADIDKLWAMSPLRYVENVTTPTLIIHSVLDHRCPIEQAEQWYTALRLHGVPTRFVRFPGEDHELSRSGRPDRRAVRLGEYLAWLEQYLNPQAAAGSAPKPDYVAAN
ncbi:S9 family peptidase [Deinococcus irradiatisoli]|uniref:S9 family peptidase n=1 Tax=Deinococcus irradiatisoli TaxID=2202254 RepID=A0A2Z3JCM5_9DEIO|nr:S9 family peptidase [Deinococcus irradiatisoli]AWN22917.1 S9 family peptidase [Deinococcus irradiatisoli]